MTSTLQPLAEITLPVPADTVARTLTALQAAIELCDGEGRKSVIEVRDKAVEAQMLLVNVIGAQHDDDPPEPRTLEQAMALGADEVVRYQERIGGDE